MQETHHHMSASEVLPPSPLESNNNTRPLTRHLVHKLSASAGANQEVEDHKATEGGNGSSNGAAAPGTTDQNYQFYKEYCRLYYANIILTNRLQQLLNEK